MVLVVPASPVTRKLWASLKPPTVSVASSFTPRSDDREAVAQVVLSMHPPAAPPPPLTTLQEQARRTEATMQMDLIHLNVRADGRFFQPPPHSFSGRC